MITREGIAWILDLLMGDLGDAVMVVRDGAGQSAQAPATAERVNDTIVLTSTFGENEANFEWRARVLRVGGVDVDVTTGDEGRKAPGAVVTAETVLEIPKQ